MKKRTPGIRKPSQHCHHCGIINQYPICKQCLKKRAQAKYQRVQQTEALRAKDNQYYRSTEWRTLRAYIIARDYHQCTNCGNTNNLHVHHITPRKQGGLDTPNNLITLCQPCHNKIEAKERNE